jgi:uncharacterized protein
MRVPTAHERRSVRCAARALSPALFCSTASRTATPRRTQSARAAHSALRTRIYAGCAELAARASVPYFSTVIRVSALHIYPIKGCAGTSLTELQLDARGPVGDRRFLVVDASGTFLTQRDTPRMALIRPQLTHASLGLEAPGMPHLEVPLVGPRGPARTVTVWRDTLRAEFMGEPVSAWLSSFLARTVELVRFDETATRVANPAYAPPDTNLGFADGYPLLLISEASLAALNARLAEPLPMDRFRPNLVVTATEPHAEDTWSTIRIGDVEFDVVKGCDRCTVTTVDQNTAVAGKEPLRTLATYRRNQGKIYFGQNVVHARAGTLKLGDALEIVATRPPLAFELER